LPFGGFGLVQRRMARYQMIDGQKGQQGDDQPDEGEIAFFHFHTFVVKSFISFKTVLYGAQSYLFFSFVQRMMDYEWAGRLPIRAIRQNPRNLILCHLAY
jgi:hypothetical protein